MLCSLSVLCSLEQLQGFTELGREEKGEGGDRDDLLEKTLESPLDCKEIQPVHSKGDQSWVFTGRTDAVANGCRSLGIQEFTKWAFPAAMATPNSTSDRKSVV